MSASSAPERVLVTGASGFVGAAVVRALVQRQRQVAVVLRHGSITRRIAPWLGQLTVVRGDLSDLQACANQVQRFAPQAVVHAAWEGVKGADRNSPTQPRNVSSSVALYDLARSAGARYFLGLGSQAEYGPMSGRICEDAAPRPRNVYGAAKLATALLLERLADAQGVAFGWLRLFSSYGPDDDPSWMIPYLIRQLLQGQRPALTACEQVWDYIHIDDVAEAVVAALDHSATGIFNLGSGVGRPLRDTVTAIRDRIDPQLPLGFGDLPYGQSQVMHLEADISALRAATGWQPRVPLEAGLASTVDWHKAQQSF